MTRPPSATGSGDGRGVYRPDDFSTSSPVCREGMVEGLRHIAIETETCHDEETGAEILGPVPGTPSPEVWRLSLLIH